MNKSQILHNVKQTKENKEKFSSILLAPLLKGKCTKKELMEITKWNERRVRQEIQEISLFYPLISYSTAKGYRVVNTPAVIKANDPELAQEEVNEIDHSLRETNKRIKMLKKKQKALIASKKEILKNVLQSCK